MKKFKGCCNVEAIVSIDERGQFVLPKEIREKMSLKKGDKLALSTLENQGEPCCIVLTKAEFLKKPVINLMGLKGK
ncbi:MAG: HgcAB-associated protein [Acidobacteria bacterium]|nr:HgcAB-associated protein [Acidobacteriota bacterium]